MTRTKFFTILFLMSVAFMFTKIYQHNLFIKISYEKQRLGNKRNELKKQKNELLVQLYKLKNQHEVKRIAQEKFGMQPMKLSQIITVTSKDL